MAQISKATIDANLREQVFTLIAEGKTEDFSKVNDRQKGIILTDLNGNERYIRIGVIVAEEREDETARELMQREVDEYNTKQAAKAEKAKAKEEKIARDKARRAEAAAKKAAKEVEKGE